MISRNSLSPFTPVSAPLLHARPHRGPPEQGYADVASDLHLIALELDHALVGLAVVRVVDRPFLPLVLADVGESLEDFEADHGAALQSRIRVLPVPRGRADQCARAPPYGGHAQRRVPGHRIICAELPRGTALPHPCYAHLHPPRLQRFPNNSPRQRDP